MSHHIFPRLSELPLYIYKLYNYHSNPVSSDLFSLIFYTLSMNLMVSLQFSTHSLIAMVLQRQLLYIIIYHTAYFSSNSLCFLSIISSILAIYCPTSLTFSHLSMRCVPSGFGTGQTRLVLAPAPHATMVCFSSMISILYTPALPFAA